MENLKTFEQFTFQLLTEKEQYIVDDILNESNFNDIIQKVKRYAKKGILTTVVLMSLMSSPSFSQSQKDQIKDIAEKEMVMQEKINFFDFKTPQDVIDFAENVNLKTVKITKPTREQIRKYLDLCENNQEWVNAFDEAHEIITDKMYEGSEFKISFFNDKAKEFANKKGITENDVLDNDEVEDVKKILKDVRRGSDGLGFIFQTQKRGDNFTKGSQLRNHFSYVNGFN